MPRLAKWAARIGLSVLALAFLLIIAGGTWERWSEVRDARRFPPPGKMVDVGDGRRHILCEGQGAPTVVLMPGGGMPSILIRPLQDRVMGFTRVCAVDRAGLGWSEPATRPLNTIGQAAELWTMLTAVGETGPFVLVGHSYGGLIVRQFAKDHAGAVTGMVLVDAAEEGLVFQSRFLETVPASVKLERNAEAASKSGVIRALAAIDPTLVRVPRPLTTEERRQAIALMVRPSYFRAAANESENAYARTPFAMQRPGGFGVLGSRPLVVIRHGRPFTGPDAVLETGWAAGQSRLAALSSNSELLVARNNGHLIIADNPGLVAEAIDLVVEAVRAHRPLNRDTSQTNWVK
jgi:pimeloyl-ACP methyl ester carboxylesterase